MGDASILQIGAGVCGVLYGAGIAILFFKNSHHVNAILVAIGACLAWPLLFEMTFMQLVFVIPLYTVFSMNGLTLPSSLSPRSIWTAFFLTVLFLTVVFGWAIASASRT